MGCCASPAAQSETEAPTDDPMEQESESGTSAKGPLSPNDYREKDNDLLPVVPGIVEKEEDVADESPDCTSSEETESEDEAVDQTVPVTKKHQKGASSR